MISFIGEKSWFYIYYTHWLELGYQLVEKQYNIQRLVGKNNNNNKIQMWRNNWNVLTEYSQN